jgi:hypothetical protein
LAEQIDAARFTTATAAASLPSLPSVQLAFVRSKTSAGPAPAKTTDRAPTRTLLQILYHLFTYSKSVATKRAQGPVAACRLLLIPVGWPENPRKPRMFRFTIRELVLTALVVGALAAGSVGIAAIMRPAAKWACDWIWDKATAACMRLEGRDSVSLQ